jgi:hypothetical protein
MDSINSLGSIIIYTGAEVIVGTLAGALIDLIFPPLTAPGSVVLATKTDLAMIFIEALFQISAAAVIMAEFFNYYNGYVNVPNPARGIALSWTMFHALPNAFGRLTLVVNALPAFLGLPNLWGQVSLPPGFAFSNNPVTSTLPASDQNGTVVNNEISQANMRRLAVKNA